MKKRHYPLIIAAVIILAVAIFFLVWQETTAPSIGTHATSTITAPNATGSPVATPTAAELGGYFTEKTSPTLGTYLADKNGLTLYTFNKDAANASTCTGTCLQAWPPYGPGISASGTFNMPMLPVNVGTIKGNNGMIQFTWKGMPLYYFAQDKKSGDALGQGLGNAWFAVVL
jgi:predicted lipoprotein with Yx(FWY)xxD motif